MPFDGPPERPLLMKGPLVVQTMEGLKTETRRIGDRFRKWKRGDLVYVRETFAIHQCGRAVRLSPELWRASEWPPLSRVRFCATDEPPHRLKNGEPYWWNKRPGIHMPKWASRLWLELTEDVRYEPLQDITEEGALAEGICGTQALDGKGHWLEPDEDPAVVGYERNGLGFARDNFRRLWNEINAARGYSWAENPEVAVIKYRLLSTTGRPS